MLNTIILYSPIIIILLVIIIMILVYFKARKPLEIEIGKTPVFSETCGAWIGNRNSTFPFVRIALYQDFAVITNLSKHIVLDYKDIMDVTEYIKYLKHGVKIAHNRKDLHERIVIWSFNQYNLIKVLKELVDKNKNH